MAERVIATTKAQEAKQTCPNSCIQNPIFNSTGSPADRILQLQRTAGNQAVQKLIKSRVLQAKLRVGQPNNIYEQEADRIAEQVMRMPDPVLQLKCVKCNGDEKNILQAKESLGHIPVTQDQDVPNIVHEVLRSPGKPIDQTTRAFMELRFGYNFSKVRVHTDAKAAESAHAMNARAYTVGQYVVFGSSQYMPTAHAGKKLLAHELTHTVQQDSGSVHEQTEAMGYVNSAAERETNQVAQPVTSGNRISVRFKTTSTVIHRTPISEELRHRIKLCVYPFYYDKQGRYEGPSPEPDCSDMTIPSDRERAWKCLDRLYWSRDGRKWIWSLDPAPKCSDLHLPVPLKEFRGETQEERALREAEERRVAIIDHNRNRIIAIRDKTSTDIEALARMFTDSKIIDDSTLTGRVHSIFDATEHTFIPGLHTGIEFGQTGFRKEFHDPWKSSMNQVGHFLTAVRLAFDPGFPNDPFLLTILDAWGDSDIPLRLIIGHEKEPDPAILDILAGFRAQYKATTEEDIANFRAGNLEAIKVGTGRGNSMADLKLSYKGWILGRWIAEGRFTKQQVADWIRHSIGTLGNSRK
jgi:hypothetical protein